MVHDIERRAVSVKDAGVMIGVGLTTAWELVRNGQLRTIRIGRRVLVPVTAIDELLEQL